MSWMARISDATKQRTVAYLSGRGQHRALTTLVTPPHWPSCANATASVCLYREQERPLICRPIVWPHPTAGLWSSIPGIRCTIASPRSRSQPVFQRVCYSARDPAAARRFVRTSRPQHRLIVQRHLTGGGGHGNSPIPSPPRLIGHCTFLSRSSCSPFTRPFCHVSGALLC